MAQAHGGPSLTIMESGALEVEATSTTVDALRADPPEEADDKPMLGAPAKACDRRPSKWLVMCCSAFALIVPIGIVATLSLTGGPVAASAPALHAADDQAAQATEAPTKALAAPQCAGGACDGCAIDASTKASIASMIAGGGTVLLGIPHVRCTLTAQSKLSSCGVKFTEWLFTPSDLRSSWNHFDTTDDAVWRYMDCKYHTATSDGMTMHSYLFVDGELLGSGFAASEHASRSEARTPD